METNVECSHIGEVYYDPEMDNYYCADCKKGMGVQYYRLAKEFEFQRWEFEVARECMALYRNFARNCEDKYFDLLKGKNE